jgi:hypothetical protein
MTSLLQDSKMKNPENCLIHASHKKKAQLGIVPKPKVNVIGQFIMAHRAQ